MKIRLFIEKKDQVNVENKNLVNHFKDFLHIKDIEKIRTFTLYDIYFNQDIDIKNAKEIVVMALTEKMTENYYFDKMPDEVYKSNIFSVALLEGQYDQKADSAASCIMLVGKIENIFVKTAKIYAIFGNLNLEGKKAIENYLVNPVDSCLFDLNYDYLKNNNQDIDNFEYKVYFLNNKSEIESVKNELNLNMSYDDLSFISQFIKKEKGGINSVELKILDTYWSDHCRHTTFNTELIFDNNIFDKFDSRENNNAIFSSLKKFFDIKEQLEKVNLNEKSLPKLKLTLMQLATINAKYFKKIGILNDVEESEEINACSVIVKDNNSKEWLIEFKNETHNHPTEIEPFGGASTCIGGSIRDPLSSRAYVFGAMRVSGSADPNQPIEKTLQGKLPQRKITTLAAKGFSSYGNQIGLATGQVIELYHENYVAKRLEAGVVIGAVPRENVIRKRPKKGDLVILVGGRTGRDGIGGATGSSKNHDEKSVSVASSEVQKGNPVIERKLQRFFSNPKVSKLIIKCNDFGAGGVAVAVGELADGLNIFLDKIPLKYMGLKPDEIILSESQERMACVIEKKNYKKFVKFALDEDLEATLIAKVVEDKNVTYFYKNNVVAKISRELLESKGAKRQVIIDPKDLNYKVDDARIYLNSYKNINIEKLLTNLNVCLQKGLNQIFDSTIGGSTIFLPYGGKYQLSPVEAMAFALPDFYENFKNPSKRKAVIVAVGFDPYLVSSNPYIGGYYSIIEAITKIVAVGGDLNKTWLSLQEYFGKTTNSEKFSKVLAALLGAFKAEQDLKIAAIGGKDSMSGTFNNIDVPPTLITFAVSVEDEDKLVPSSFMKENSFVYLLFTPMDENLMLDKNLLLNNFKFFKFLVNRGQILSSRTVKGFTINESIIKSCFGNKIGFEISTDNKLKDILYCSSYGSIIFETNLDQNSMKKLYNDFKNSDIESCSQSKINITLIGKTKSEKKIKIYEKDEIKEFYIENLIEIARRPLENIFPVDAKEELDYTMSEVNEILPKQKVRFDCKTIKLNKKPKALILVFNGTNCEFDTQRAFNNAGIETELVIIKTLNKNLLNDSIDICSKKILKSNIICLAGGFSMGDEPDGSGKFIVSFLKSNKIKESIEKHLEKKNLILGICNGFQALIKSGLLPYGKIIDLTENDPSLIQNISGSHISRFVYCKVLPNKSPWHILSDYDKIYSIPISHSEGRFFCSKDFARTLFLKGQVSSIYVDNLGLPAISLSDNPNGSIYAIESIISPDGLILGKMGHTERVVKGRVKNYPDAIAEPIFESAYKYFS